jgi:nicotinamide riboside kinase
MELNFMTPSGYSSGHHQKQFFKHLHDHLEQFIEHQEQFEDDADERRSGVVKVVDELLCMKDIIKYCGTLPNALIK